MCNILDMLVFQRDYACHRALVLLVNTGRNRSSILHATHDIAVHRHMRRFVIPTAPEEESASHLIQRFRGVLQRHAQPFMFFVMLAKEPSRETPVLIMLHRELRADANDV